MIVNTQRLFTSLLPTLRIGAVCDVGSMNGADAMLFSAAVPHGSVYAFEPNPLNFRLMQANRALQERDIQLVPLAATNYDGEADFFLVEAEYSSGDPRRGMSSLYQRTGEWGSSAAVRVKTVRLDTFLADKCPVHARLALWIDTEGQAYEVIDGLGSLAQQVRVLHIEVETSPCIGANQKLYPEVKSLLQRLGFRELATDQSPSQIQFNALFVRPERSPLMKLRVAVLSVRARLRHITGRAIYRACPWCLARYRAMRLRRS